MPFLHQEEAFLASRRACSRMLKGLSLNVGGRGQDWREAKNVYKFGACGKRGQRGRGRSERWGKNGEDNREQEGGGGRKKLISMKIIG